MKKADHKKPIIQELELELVPDSVNDEHYDGVIHISSRSRRPKFGDRNEHKRNAFQTFTFD